MDSLVNTFLVLIGFIVSASAKITWDKTWLNNNVPYANGTEIEPPPNATYLASVCPAGSGGTLALRCQDRKGEPFTGFQNNSVLQFVATCDPRLGILCNKYIGSNESCPDLQMNFGCDIPDPTTTTTTTTMVPGKNFGTTKKPQDATSTNRQTGTSPTKVSQTKGPTKSPKGTTTAKIDPSTSALNGPIRSSPAKNPHSTSQPKSPNRSNPTKSPNGSSPTKSPNGNSPTKSPNGSSPTKSHSANTRVSDQAPSSNRQNKGRGDGNGTSSIAFSLPLFALAMAFFVLRFQDI